MPFFRCSHSTTARLGKARLPTGVVPLGAAKSPATITRDWWAVDGVVSSATPRQLCLPIGLVGWSDALALIGRCSVPSKGVAATLSLSEQSVKHPLPSARRAGRTPPRVQIACSVIIPAPLTVAPRVRPFGALPIGDIPRHEATGRGQSRCSVPLRACGPRVSGKSAMVRLGAPLAEASPSVKCKSTSRALCVRSEGGGGW